MLDLVVSHLREILLHFRAVSTGPTLQEMTLFTTHLRFAFVIAAHASFLWETQETVVVICLQANKQLEMAQVSYV